MDWKQELLSRMIAIPSPSRDEKAVADMLEAFLLSQGLPVHRLRNNLWLESCPPCGKPVILLNAHIDTVKPVSGWSSDPFTPAIVPESTPEGAEDMKIIGLGANDDGGSVVAMLEAYKILVADEQPYRLVLTLTAEEEVSGKNGIELILPFVCGEESLPLQIEGRGQGKASENGNGDSAENACSEPVSKSLCYPGDDRIALAVVGEPTGMQMAVAEKGLMVLDCTAYGRSGHAARNEGVNAIYKALPVVEWFENHRFEKVSPFLGPVKMSVTQIQAGTQHNVVPDKCSFVVDVRSNDCYTNTELLSEIQAGVKNVVMFEPVAKHNVCGGDVLAERCDTGDLSSVEIKARSTRLGSSHIDVEHPVVQRGLALGLNCFGSPTLSNQALLHCPTLKIGPGDSARSHTANEFIRLSEIEQAVDIYVKLLGGLSL